MLATAQFVYPGRPGYFLEHRFLPAFHSSPMNCTRICTRARGLVVSKPAEEGGAADHEVVLAELRDHRYVPGAVGVGGAGIDSYASFDLVRRRLDPPFLHPRRSRRRGSRTRRHHHDGDLSRTPRELRSRAARGGCWPSIRRGSSTTRRLLGDVRSRTLISAFAPSRTNNSAVARPIPRAEPMTIAAFPSRSLRLFFRSVKSRREVGGRLLQLSTRVCPRPSKNQRAQLCRGQFSALWHLQGEGAVQSICRRRGAKHKDNTP
jgi:hypothetical protein